jgi:hypothetical protein
MGNCISMQCKRFLKMGNCIPMQCKFSFLGNVLFISHGLEIKDATDTLTYTSKLTARGG